MVGEGVFTICVVLDQSTVIFQKGGYYNLCGIEIKIVASDTPHLQYYDVQTLEYRYISKLIISPSKF
jgi:hypothetical protein